jgi:hypothetical protein
LHGLCGALAHFCGSFVIVVVIVAATAAVALTGTTPT